MSATNHEESPPKYLVALCNTDSIADTEVHSNDMAGQPILLEIWFSAGEWDL